MCVYDLYMIYMILKTLRCVYVYVMHEMNKEINKRTRMYKSSFNHPPNRA